MNDLKLMNLLQENMALMVSLTASHRALERVVMALVDTHPNKPALLARLKKHFEVDVVSDLYEPMTPPEEQAYTHARARLLTAVRAVCLKGRLAATV
jgi:hypothetical protein